MKGARYLYPHTQNAKVEQGQGNYNKVPIWKVGKDGRYTAVICPRTPDPCGGECGLNSVLGRDSLVHCSPGLLLLHSGRFFLLFSLVICEVDIACISGEFVLLCQSTFCSQNVGAPRFILRL